MTLDTHQTAGPPASVTLDQLLGDLLAELIAARALIGMTDYGREHREAAAAVALARALVADALDRVQR